MARRSLCPRLFFAVMEEDRMFETTRLKVDLLTSEIYFLWSNCTEIALRGKGFWGIVSGSESEPDIAVDDKSGTAA